jgi:hypothetical protein
VRGIGQNGSESEPAGRERVRVGKEEDEMGARGLLFPWVIFIPGENKS